MVILNWSLNPQMLLLTEVVFGGVSQPDLSSATGSDESRHYIMPLALSQGTSDGKHCPWPSLRVTHWHAPNMVREHEFYRKLSAFFSPNVLTGKWLWHLKCLETHRVGLNWNWSCCESTSFTCLDLFWSCLSMKD